MRHTFQLAVIANHAHLYFISLFLLWRTQERNFEPHRENRRPFRHNETSRFASRLCRPRRSRTHRCTRKQQCADAPLDRHFSLAHPLSLLTRNFLLYRCCCSIRLLSPACLSFVFVSLKISERLSQTFPCLFFLGKDIMFYAYLFILKKFSITKFISSLFHI